MDNQQFQNYTIGLAQQEQERRAIHATRKQIRDLIRQTQTQTLEVNSQPEPRTLTALRDATRPRCTRTCEAVCSEMTDHAPDRWNVSTADKLVIMHAIVDSRPPGNEGTS